MLRVDEVPRVSMIHRAFEERKVPEVYKVPRVPCVKKLHLTSQEQKILLIHEVPNAFINLRCSTHQWYPSN
jgi:hypothetical protein